MKIGIMGGTFDPIHNGHLMIAGAAYRQYGLDEVRFMPNGNPPHKDRSKISSGVKDRVEMVRLAIEDYAYFTLETYEADRDTVSCSYETMEHFKKLCPDDEFFFIIGADSLAAIDTWVHPERLFPTCTILAACRDDLDTTEEMDELIRGLEGKYGARIGLVVSPLMDISSTGLRKLCREKRSIHGYVPEKVEQYIEREDLYES